MGEKSSIFLRTATGLVKPWSIWDAYIYNVFAVNPFLIYGFAFVNALGVVPGGNMWTALAIVGIATIFLAYNEAGLISTMPRSGGDYVFQSRILGGKLGFSLTWGLMIVNQPILLGMIAGWWCADMILAPFFTIYGSLLNNAWLASTGVWMTTQIGIFVMAVIGLTWFTIINLAGMAWYRRLQKIFFILGSITLVIMLVMLATVGVGDFATAFNGFATTVFGKDPGAYNLLLDKAYELGFNPAGAPGMEAFIMSIPFAIGAMAVAWSAYNAGEIKGAASLKAQIAQVVYAAVTALVLSYILYFAIVHSAGHEWYRAASWMYWNHGDVYGATVGPIAPFFGLVLGIALYQNPIALFMVFITFQLWFWMWIPNVQLAVSRYMLALSFDRVFPESIGKVHPKTRTPYVAVLVIFVLALIWSWVFSHPAAMRFATLVSLVGIIGYAGSGLAGTILPKVRKDLFKGSPTSKHIIGSIPLISICGAVWVIYSIICSVLFLGDPRFFLFDPASVAFFIATYLSGVLMYYGYKAYRRGQGIDVEMAYKEIPVE